MEIPQVPAASIAGMFFSLILCVGVPIGLCVFVRKKYHGSWLGLLAGAVTFMAAAMVLEQLLHALVFMVAEEAITGNLWLYALYGAVVAAVFEEGGRYLVMKQVLLKRNQLNRENALMYGVGHGGMEAILVTGLTYVNNINIAILINNGGIQSSLDALDEAGRAAAVQSLTVLGTTDSVMFYMGGVERVLALALQISLSVLVYEAVRFKLQKCFLAALLIHFGVNFITVMIAPYLPVVAVEFVLLVMVAAVVWFARRQYQREA